jgi:hypothetical protein
MLMTFGINLLLAGDLIMGLGSVGLACFILTMIVRHVVHLKKEGTKIDVKECLSCRN